MHKTSSSLEDQPTLEAYQQLLKQNEELSKQHQENLNTEIQNFITGIFATCSSSYRVKPSQSIGWAQSYIFKILPHNSEYLKLLLRVRDSDYSESTIRDRNSKSTRLSDEIVRTHLKYKATVPSSLSGHLGDQETRITIIDALITQISGILENVFRSRDPYIKEARGKIASHLRALLLDFTNRAIDLDLIASDCISDETLPELCRIILNWKATSIYTNELFIKNCFTLLKEQQKLQIFKQIIEEISVKGYYPDLSLIALLSQKHGAYGINIKSLRYIIAYNNQPQNIDRESFINRTNIAFYIFIEIAEAQTSPQLCKNIIDKVTSITNTDEKSRIIQNLRQYIRTSDKPDYSIRRLKLILSVLEDKKIELEAPMRHESSNCYRLFESAVWELSFYSTYANAEQSGHLDSLSKALKDSLILEPNEQDQTSSFNRILSFLIEKMRHTAIDKTEYIAFEKNLYSNLLLCTLEDYQLRLLPSLLKNITNINNLESLKGQYENLETLRSLFTTLTEAAAQLPVSTDDTEKQAMHTCLDQCIGTIKEISKQEHEECIQLLLDPLEDYFYDLAAILPTAIEYPGRNKKLLPEKISKCENCILSTWLQATTLELASLFNEESTHFTKLKDCLDKNHQEILKLKEDTIKQTHEKIAKADTLTTQTHTSSGFFGRLLSRLQDPQDYENEYKEEIKKRVKVIDAFLEKLHTALYYVPCRPCKAPDQGYGDGNSGSSTPSAPPADMQSSPYEAPYQREGNGEGDSGSSTPSAPPIHPTPNQQTSAVVIQPTHPPETGQEKYNDTLPA